MPQHDPARIVANIERLLAEHPDLTQLEPSVIRGLLAEVRPDASTSSPQSGPVMNTLGHSILPSLRSFQQVGSIPPGTRLAFPKKILARIMRLFTAPQSTYNELSASAVQVLGEHHDQLARRLGEREGAAAARDEVLLQVYERLFTVIQQQAQELAQTRKDVQQLYATREELLQLQGVVSAMDQRMAAFASPDEFARRATEASMKAFNDEINRLDQRVENTSRDLWSGIAERDRRHDELHRGLLDLHGEQEAALRRETTRLDLRIEDGNAALWSGLQERDERHQELHRGLLHLHGDQEAALREEVARLDLRIEASTEAIWTGIKDRDQRITSLLHSVEDSFREMQLLHRRIDDTTQDLWKGHQDRDAQIRELYGISSDLTERLDDFLGALTSMDPDALKLLQQEGNGPMFDELRRKISRIPRVFSIVRDLQKSIEDRADAIWAGIKERDRQIGLVTDTVRVLHTENSELETQLREIRARLLVMNEQLTQYHETVEKLHDPIYGGDEDEHWRGDGDGGAATMRRSPSNRRVEQANRLLEMAYLRFQRQYRGDEEQLRKLQTRYIDLLAAHFAAHPSPVEIPRVLDIACGDGIFLQMAATKGWSVRGMDTNPTMVKIGRERGVTILEQDAIVALEECDEDQFDAIVTFQFIEHLNPNQLMRLLRAARHALAPGGVIIMETINPHTIMALRWYFLDLTHERLVFPEMLSLLVETVGLRVVGWKGINPVSEEQRLQLKGAADENIAQLNDLLYGDQDYYLVAQKVDVPEDH